MPRQDFGAFEGKLSGAKQASILHTLRYTSRGLAITLFFNQGAPAWDGWEQIRSHSSFACRTAYVHPFNRLIPHFPHTLLHNRSMRQLSRRRLEVLVVVAERELVDVDLAQPCSNASLHQVGREAVCSMQHKSDLASQAGPESFEPGLRKVSSASLSVDDRSPTSRNRAAAL